MQTFLPYSDFTKTASVLDNKRLGKQRVENLQILKALLTGKGWIHHPATKQWKDHYYHFCMYHKAICDEWTGRGYEDTTFEKFLFLLNELVGAIPLSKPPLWLGYEEFHASHRSNLMRKDSNHYGQFHWTEHDNLPYYWPTHHGMMHKNTFHDPIGEDDDKVTFLGGVSNDYIVRFL